MIFRVKANAAFTKTPSLGIREGNEDKNVLLFAVNENEYKGSYFPSSTFIGERVAELRAEIGGNELTTSEAFSLIPISPNRRGEVYSSDGGLKVAFDKDAVFRPLFLTYVEKNNDALKMYSLFPDDEMLDGGVNVTLYYPKEINARHLGFYFNDGIRWKFHSSKKDTVNRSVTSKLARTFGTVALFIDSVPPTITRLKLRGTGTSSVSFGVHDNLSGVNVNDAKIFVDGKLVVPQVSEGGTYFAVFNKLSLGKHHLKITARDRIGNETKTEQTITIR
jgi:hypothetical protein